MKVRKVKILSGPYGGLYCNNLLFVKEYIENE